MARVGKSVIQSSLANFGSLAISLALVVVVSRILPPDVIGAYVMAFAVLMLIEPLRDLQLKSYLLMQDRIDAEVLGPARFVALANTLAAVVACLLLALVLRSAYDSPAVGNCLAIMGLGLLARPWAQTAEAVLAKAYRYGAIAQVKLGAVLLKVAVTLGLIARGYGAEALAWGAFAEFACELASLGMIGRDLRFVMPSRRGSAEVFRFCSQFGGAQLFGGLGGTIEPLMIGTFQGLAWTAFFNRANRLVRTLRSGIEQAIHPIVLTGFAGANGDRVAMRRDYLRTIALMTGVVWPALACFAVLADPVILGLFGPQWGKSILLGQILALGGIVHAATALSQQLHAAAGEARLVFRREAGLTLLRFVILGLTVTISTTAVALGLLAMLVVSFFVNQHLLQRSFGMTYGAFARAVWKSAAAALLVALAAHLALGALSGGMSRLAMLGALVPVAGVVWLAALALLRHPLLHEMRQLVARHPS
ncbi:oligosaccharide flippase family protein [Altererythrobacter sp.]|uniref:oligosaccharide flippase family protein n=1 Tax=Altererythrobacter sp. TaxID=1872480 RepID=UPI003CFFBAD7